MERFLGIGIGLCTFLIIGLFHPLVIKGYYYFGLRCRVAFLILGIATAAASVAVSSLFWSILFGVIAFSSFWSIKEVGEQKARVEKGWFPGNPRLGQEPLRDGDVYIGSEVKELTRK